MDKPRILITDGLSSEGVEILERAAEIVLSPAVDELPKFDAVIVRGKTKLTAGVISTGSPRLRVIGRAGVGVDNIDLQAAKRYGIVVVNSPFAPTIAVAEHALGLILGLARNIPQADASMRSGKWQKSEFIGSELAGKTLGIMGMGKIGSALGIRAAAMGMIILGFDAYLEEDAIKERGAQPSTFASILKESDYISIHLPLTEDTRGMLGADELSMMKAGARIVSTARGGIVDETALLEKLNSGHLAGAALDVFENEPPRPDGLVQHRNVISTPHIGAQTKEAQARTALDIASEVLAALRHQSLRWRVI